MQKSLVESVIDRYYLNGLVEGVKWEINNKNIIINFTPEEKKSLVGIIKCSDIDIRDSEILIYNTSQLIKLIKILGNDISLDIYSERNIPIKLLLADNKFDLEFYLADKNLINKDIPSINEPSYEIEFDICKDDFIDRFKNAKKGLGNDITKFTIEANQFIEKQLTITVGDLHNFSNKVKFNVPIESTESISSIPFEADLFNEILIANEDAKEGKFYLSQHGLIKLFFKKENIESVYYLVRLADS